MAKHGLPLGIDIGGSGIKGAPVDLETGEFAGKRLRIDTPTPSTPEAVAEVVDQIVDHFADDRGDSPDRRHHPRRRHPRHRPLGRQHRQVVDRLRRRDRSSRRRSAATSTLVNDADAAGVAELHYGAAKGQQGPGRSDHPRHRHRHAP